MNVFELPVDQYQRYRIAADAVNALRGERRSMKVLEVGGHPPRLGHFLPDDEVLVTDIVESDEPGYLRANGLDLPFADDSFETVVSLDVLEHISPGNRAPFVEELCRVAGQFMVIAAPFDDGEGVISRAESLIFDFIRDNHGYEHEFLKQHIAYGLPSIHDTIDILHSRGWRIHTLSNGYFPHWFAMILLEYTCELDTKLDIIKDKMREYMNYHFYRRDNREPAYRHAVVASRTPFSDPQKAALHKIASTGPSAGWPPMEYLSTLVEMARLDTQRRLEAKIEGLEHDLAAREDEIRHLKDYIAELEDFAGKIKSLLPYRIYEKILKTNR